jgi:hypothetical protein
MDRTAMNKIVSEEEWVEARTRVVSTKLSIEYYNKLQTITNRVYRNKGINKPTISELLRFMINHILDEMRNSPRFSEQQIK